MEHSTHDNTLELSGALDVRCTADLRIGRLLARSVARDG